MKTTKKIVALLLSVLIIFTMVSASTAAVAQAIEETELQEVEDSGETLSLFELFVESIHNFFGNIFAVFDWPCLFCGEVHGENEKYVTREEWINALAETMDIEAAEYQFYTFDDYAETENPSIIETAYVRNWFELIADEDNIVLFGPDDLATREFVAVTSTNALLYDITTLEMPGWTDVSETEYPLNDFQAIKSNILTVENNKFNPEKAITYSEMNSALQAVKSILDDSEANNETSGTINYADGIEETTLSYRLDENAKKVYVYDKNIVKDWQLNEIHVLKNEEDSSKDVAIKIVNIKEENGYIVVTYTEPDIEDVITDFNVEGKTNTGIMFTPAEGITVVSSDSLSTMAAVSDTVELIGSTTLDIDKLDTTITFDLESLEYRFVASPSWHLVSIDEVYVALNSSITTNIEIEDLEFEPDPIKIGNIDCPVGFGFNASVELYLVFEAEAGVEVVFEVSGKSGVQYTKNTGMRFVNTLTPEITPINFIGSAQAGVDVEVAAEFLGIDIVAVTVSAGIGLDGELTPISSAPLEFCLDGTLYFYLNISTNIGPEDWELLYIKDIFDSENSIYRKNLHFEETGRKDECTRGSGTYKGSVMRADDIRIPVKNAKIQVFSGGYLKDTTITDSHGNFVGASLPSGNYTIRVSCSGYVPYERSFDIIGGQATVLATQLIISRENEGENGWDSRTCSGYVADAYTGSRISGATVEIRTQHLVGNDDLIDVITTDSNGYFEFIAPIGQYEITVIKNGYVTNATSITLFEDVTGAYIVMNPENQNIVDGGLRAVLQWGPYPRDLDAHMVGPEGNGTFHVYYSDKNSDYASLDYDYTNGNGIETITITQTEDGTYSYYVHDYSNRGSSSSKEMSNSGAKVQLYDGNRLLYTINIPTNQSGTLWHVFDYDSETGLITLVNEFSYESNPSDVGY